MKNKENRQFSLLNKLKWGLYSARVKLYHLLHKEKQEEKISNTKHSARRMQGIFIFFFALFPVVQFLVFYFGVNINSILLAFQKYENGKFVLSGFENFAEVILDIFSTSGDLRISIINSAIQFLLSAISIPLHIMVAYAVFKNVPFSGFFKIILFMPNMISSMVFVICGTEIINEAIPILLNDNSLWLLNPKAVSSFWTVLIFGFWMNFASGLIIYLSAMASISIDIMEYGKLEKLSSIKELWYVVVPSIFPTVITYIVVAFAGFFTNQGFFFSFFGGNAYTTSPYDTLGYIFFVKIAGDDASQALYPYAAAGGLLFTIIITPITIGVKALLEKYGPSEE